MTTLENADRDELKEALKQALVQAGMLAGEPLPPEMEQATLALVPREDGLAPKSIPVESLLTKVVSIRDKLRVTEQRINASDHLSLTRKLELQAAITQVQSVLVGLNALLRMPPDKDDDNAAAKVEKP